MFTSLEIHSLLLDQIGNVSEISDYRNDSVIIADSIMLPNQKGLVAIDMIPKNSIIFSYKNSISYNRTKSSIQVSVDCHLEPGNYGVFANHSCKPNAYMWTALREDGQKGHVVLIAIEDIAKGQEITFDYATTEFSLIPELQGTQCYCREFGCRRYMKGFSDLSPKEQSQLLATKLGSAHVLEHRMVM